VRGKSLGNHDVLFRSLAAKNQETPHCRGTVWKPVPDPDFLNFWAALEEQGFCMRVVVKNTFSAAVDKTRIFKSIGHLFGIRDDARKPKVAHIGGSSSDFFRFVFA
jgi:hypothetical protein